MVDYERLQNKLGYHFKNLTLLSLALTHCSYGSENNERLEFLGDALLNATIAQLLFSQFPDEREGSLSRLRSSLVKGETLADLAREFSLSDYLIMGEGELKSGGFRRDSILADAVESIIAAIYLDGGLPESQAFIGRIFERRLSTLSVDKYLKDPKTRLQELLQGRQLPLPNYVVVNIEGESHQQQFMVRCETALLKEGPVATASSRRQAEKMAAQKVLHWLEGKENE